VWQHGRIAFNRDDLYRQLRLFCQHAAHQSCGEHAGAGSRIEHAQCAGRWQARQGGDQLSGRSGGEELPQVALRARVEAAEGGDSLDLGDA